jgi:hypothetical protein
MPMRSDAHLSPRDIAEPEAEFLEALDSRDVTLVRQRLGLVDDRSRQSSRADRPVGDYLVPSLRTTGPWLGQRSALPDR